MRILRRRGHEQPEWTLRAFLDAPAPALPESWTERIGAVHQKLNQAVRRAQTPLEWAESLPELLTEAGWPGHRTLSSADYQTMQSWKKSVEAAGSLGFDGRRTSLHGFLDALGRIQEEILFAPESSETPILVAGPAESAGLTANAIWFLGADEDHWPAPGSAHPFLPLAVQREAGMPHTSAQLDAEVIEAVTRRLLCTAPEVHFSYAALNKDAEVRPSRILLRLVGGPTPLSSPSPASETEVQTILFPDTSKIPFTQISISGGAAVLTAQSNCPFRAFATARLAAKSWEAAQDGLTASQRGQLLHAVLHSIWSGPPRGLSSLQDLLRIGERAEFVSKHVNEALHTEFHAELRARLPQRYLELEAERMTRLITQWMDYEAARAEFSVESREVDRTISLAGITIRLRLDRLDRLNDGSVLVIDYKSGDVKPSTWELPRPEDVQLPLYAGFALDRDTEPLGGLVFAKIRPGQQEFVGRVADAKNTLRPELKGTAALLKKPLEIEDLEAWRACIEQLTADFVAGKADVDPKDAPKSCEHCNLQSLCRIGALHSDDEEEEDA